VGWKKLAGILGGVASVLAILTYFGIQPHSRSDASDNPRPAPANTLPAAVTTRPTLVRTTAAQVRAATGVVEGPAGSTLHVYSGPSMTSMVINSVPVGATVTIMCTVYGGAATNLAGQTSNLWDRISTGYVPDVDVNTGTNNPVAPPC
jgi:hypothetical protein